MATLDEVIEIAYRSSANAYAAANAKWEISNTARLAARDARDAQVPDSAAWREEEARMALWNNLHAALAYARRFYERETIGVKDRLEALYGGSSLASWSTLREADLKTVVSFVTSGGVNWATVETAQSNFTGNTSEIPTTPWLDQFEEMFNLFINDIWASEGMREYCNDELDRVPVSVGDLADWDSIVSDAGDFFANARRCCVRIANNLAQVELGGPNEVAYIAKYTYGPSNAYKALNGLWGCDADDLPISYAAKLENKIVTW